MDASMFMLPQWMYAVAKLNIPEMLHRRALTSAEIANTVDACPDRIERLMHALCQQGYFKIVRSMGTARWMNTAKTEVLIQSHPNTIRPLLFHWVEDCYGPSTRLLDALNSQASAFELYHEQPGMDFFSDYLEARPTSHAQFANAMTASSAFTDRAVMDDFSWSRFDSVIDIGGSQGSFILPLMDKYTKLNATIFDLPKVIEESKRALSDHRENSSGRLNFQSGDFFDHDTIPKIGAGAAFVLRNILHDWSDSKCEQILTNLASAMTSQDSRIILIELGRAANKQRSNMERGRTTIDLLMMTMFAGKERTPAEFESLLNAAGLELVAIHKTRSIAQVVEAKLATAN
ncbi:MAG: methyltransferase [Myxococcota bacterium]|nr:methyltransferase [Myxococcota bacterium]